MTRSMTRPIARPMTEEPPERKHIVANIRESAAAMQTMLADIRDTATRSRKTIIASRNALRRLDDVDGSTIPGRGPDAYRRSDA